MVETPSLLPAGSAVFAFEHGAREHEVSEMTGVELMGASPTASEYALVGSVDQRQQIDEMETVRTLSRVATQLQHATHELEKLAAAHADGVERRGDEIDAMLAQIRSAMATTVA